MHYWPLQEAKAKLSELVHLTIKKGPQGISIRGKEEVIVISKKDYDHFTGAKPNFVTLLQMSPLKGMDLEFERDKSLPREDAIL